ncbi:hypothetical protein Fmac_001447 [Flemingia macrophylla]|uniref:Uncharacterized protein n=1 Tax=Flemingia macrophylla TaxID=520843 RepID=A0ABD1NID7_9FABA
MATSKAMMGCLLTKKRAAAAQESAKRLRTNDNILVRDASVISILKEVETLTTRVVILTWSAEGQVRSSNSIRKKVEKEVSLLRERDDKLVNNVATLEEEKQLSMGEKTHL